MALRSDWLSLSRFANAGDFCRGRKDSARREQHRQEDENGDQQFNKGEGSLHGQSSRTVTYTGSMRRPERSVTGTNQMRSTVWYQYRICSSEGFSGPMDSEATVGKAGRVGSVGSPSRGSLDRHSRRPAQ